MSRSQADKVLINTMRQINKDINTSVDVAVQPSLGDVIEFDGRDYDTVITSGTLIANTSARLTQLDGGTFDFNYSIGKTSITTMDLDAGMQAAIAANLEGLNIGVDSAKSIGWKFSHEDAKSARLSCGCDGSASLADSDEFFRLISEYYKNRDDWRHERWGVVDRVYYSNYRVLSYSESKQTELNIGATVSMDATMPIPDTPGNASAGASERMGFTMLNNTTDGIYTMWPESLDRLTSNDPRPFVVGFTMKRASKDMKDWSHWAP